MYIIAEVPVGHDEQRDVGQRAHVRELLQLVLDQSVPDPAPEKGLFVKCL